MEEVRNLKKMTEDDGTSRRHNNSTYNTEAHNVPDLFYSDFDSNHRHNNNNNNNNEPVIKKNTKSKTRTPLKREAVTINVEKITNILTERLLEAGNPELLKFFTYPISSSYQQQTDGALPLIGRTHNCASVEAAQREMIRMDFIKSVLNTLSDKRRYYKGEKSNSFSYWRNQVLIACEQHFPEFLNKYEKAISSHTGAVVDVHFSQRRVYPGLLFLPDADFNPYWFKVEKSKSPENGNVQAFYCAAKGAEEILSLLNHTPKSFYEFLVENFKSNTKDYIADEIYNDVLTLSPKFKVNGKSSDKHDPLTALDQKSNEIIRLIGQQKLLLESLKQHFYQADVYTLKDKVFNNHDYIDGYNISDNYKDAFKQLKKLSINGEDENIERTKKNVTNIFNSMSNLFEQLSSLSNELYQLSNNEKIKCHYLVKHLSNEGGVTITPCMILAYNAARKNNDTVIPLNIFSIDGYELSSTATITHSEMTVAFDQSNEAPEIMILSPLNRDKSTKLYQNYLSAKQAYHQYCLDLKSTWFAEVENLLFNEVKNKFLPHANLLCQVEQKFPVLPPNASNEDKKSFEADTIWRLAAMQDTEKFGGYYSNHRTANFFGVYVINAFRAKHEAKELLWNPIVETHKKQHTYARPPFNESIDYNEQVFLLNELQSTDMNSIMASSLDQIFIDINCMYYREEPLICSVVRLQNTNLAVKYVNLFIEQGLNLFQTFNGQLLISRLHALYTEKHQALKIEQKSKQAETRSHQRIVELQQISDRIEHTQHWHSKIYQHAFVQLEKLVQHSIDEHDASFSLKTYLGKLITLLKKNVDLYGILEPKIATPLAKKTWSKFSDFLHDLLHQLYKATLTQDVETLHKWLRVTEKSLNITKKKKSRKTPFLNDLKNLINSAEGLFSDAYCQSFAKISEVMHNNNEIVQSSNIYEHAHDDKLEVHVDNKKQHTAVLQKDKDEMEESEGQDNSLQIHELLKQKEDLLKERDEKILSLQKEIERLNSCGLSQTNNSEEIEALKRKIKGLGIELADAKTEIKQVKEHNKTIEDNAEKLKEDILQLEVVQEELLTLIDEQEKTIYHLQSGSHQESATNEEPSAEDDDSFVRPKPSEGTNFGTNNSFFESPRNTDDNTNVNRQLNNNEVTNISKLFDEESNSNSDSVSAETAWREHVALSKNN